MTMLKGWRIVVGPWTPRPHVFISEWAILLYLYYPCLCCVMFECKDRVSSFPSWVQSRFHFIWMSIFTSEKFAETSWYSTLERSQFHHEILFSGSKITLFMTAITTYWKHGCEMNNDLVIYRKCIRLTFYQIPSRWFHVCCHPSKTSSRVFPFVKCRVNSMRPDLSIRSRDWSGLSRKKLVQPANPLGELLRPIQSVCFQLEIFSIHTNCLSKVHPQQYFIRNQRHLDDFPRSFMCKQHHAAIRVC